ncbi:MAG: prolyl oligopeptidase family serine peptidase [Candidatus Brocadiae bacterium]|nr:prolyl oligopeptidase family serine peptidase [Candidatus Brocadiia bacterium]
MFRRGIVLAFSAAALLAGNAARADEWRVAGPLKGGSRAMIGPDPLLEYLNGPAADRTPEPGEAIGGAVWRAATPDDAGVLRDDGLAPGVAHVTMQSPREVVVLLRVHGASVVYVNGVPCAGDVYASGIGWVPVALRAGTNTIAARCGRGQFSWMMRTPPAPVCLNDSDLTLPSLVERRPATPWAAVPVLNATREWVRDAVLVDAAGETPLPPLAPLGVLKVPFRLEDGPASELRVRRGTAEHRIAVSLGRNRGRHEGRTVTFRSRIDDSVQACAWAPPAAPQPAGAAPALIFTLHGAGVWCQSHLDAYPSLSWASILAPQNRRQYGFDWEDWGRLDALEALEVFCAEHPVDRSRIYLAGHSMGGHGTWQLGVHFPDRWAAIAPSAGWLSHYTYPPWAKRDPAPELADPARRSAAPSDTMALFRNLDGLPVFIIHGLADDNVPPDQAHLALAALRASGHDAQVLFREGAGHWWDGPDPGADCVSPSVLIDWLQRHRRPDALSRYVFRTVSPAVSATCRDVTIFAQTEPYAVSSAEVAFGQERRPDLTWRHLCRVVTSGAAHVAVRARGSELILDGVEFPRDGEFHRAPDGTWTPGPPPGLRKTPARQGPFAQAFHTPFLFVLPTGGSPAEREDALRFARLQAQLWWYRGNGRALVLADTDVTEQDWRERNLILIGSAASNACWKRIDATLPFRAVPGEVRAGAETLEGDFALAAVYPLPGSAERLVAVVGASGPEARRTWLSMQWFGSNAGTPDLAVWDAGILRHGREAMRVAGIFGPDWAPYEPLWKTGR